MAVMLDMNRKRTQRLMGILGIEALYLKPHLSHPAPGHEIYPYMLRSVSIERPNQVWSTDITYVPRRGGFLYLVALSRSLRVVIPARQKDIHRKVRVRAQAERTSHTRCHQ